MSQPNKKFVLYCHTGQRTYLALQKLKNDNIHHLVGGISNWIGAGEKSTFITITLIKNEKFFEIFNTYTNGRAE